jgi:glutamine cyclotransferase
MALHHPGRAASRQPQVAPVMYSHRVVNVYPHDPQAYTQGLIYRDGFLYESTGLNGRSSVRKVELATGRVVQRLPIDSKYFGEGLTEWRGQLIQLTWQSGIAFTYDMGSFKQLATLKYAGEGWGLTHDGTRLILSDGSPTLRFMDPATFAESGRVTVRDRGQPLRDINELEFIDGEIYANVWQTNRIARINAATGAVVGWVDLTGLLARGEVRDPDAVLNGIAYDAVGRRLFVTGKLWPKLFEIRLERR